MDWAQIQNLGCVTPREFAQKKIVCYCSESFEQQMFTLVCRVSHFLGHMTHYHQYHVYGCLRYLAIKQYLFYESLAILILNPSIKLS